MSKTTSFAAGILVMSAALHICSANAFDAAAAFGARESVMELSLSPDGRKVAYVSPKADQGESMLTLSLEKGAKPQLAMTADGKPLRFKHCGWVSADRLVCMLYAMGSDPLFGPLLMTRWVSVNADGTNPKVLSTQQNPHTRGLNLYGGAIIDWLPDEDGAVLMTRNYVPDERAGTHLASSDVGLGVDRVDTRTLAVTHVIHAVRDAVLYLTDGRGNVRIMGERSTHAGGMDRGVIKFLYRPQNSSDWHALGTYNEMDRTGFLPAAVDHDLNVVYGYKKKDGRLAVYSVSLDESQTETLLFARPDVDVDHLVGLGQRSHVVGASFVTDTRQVSYIQPEMRQLVASLAKATHEPLLHVVGSSVDESRLLVFAGSDTDPGVYYIFDRASHQLETFLVKRGQLEDTKLAKVKPITYPAADGVEIPAYLTLPPGHEDAKGLPAIVLPHGGPEARDEWGFDWLSQFYAARGFAVLQPNFRGSSGYGDAWFQKNGFQSWRIAVGDVAAGGRWLVKEGIADPAKLSIVGWSYGGYAALQAAVYDPTVFKAVVAIAPVTDLSMFKEEHRNWSDFELVSNFVGDGPEMHAGSPAEHADKIKVPVLLFHGGLDRNVNIEQSRRMAARLKAAGAQYELVTWDNLDHYLEDSAARQEMLGKSDAFLRKATGM